MNIIDSLPDNIKNVFKKLINKNGKFNGLITILRNHFYNINKQIYGSLFYGAERIVYLYSPEMNKYVYLIGEFHQEYKPCKNAKHLGDLIVNYLKYSDKFIDIFLETSIKLKGVEQEIVNRSKSNTNIINKLKIDLSNCLLLSKENCDYPNTRVHYIDSRHVIYDLEYQDDLSFFIRLLSTLYYLSLNIYSNFDQYKNYIFTLHDYFNNDKLKIKLYKKLFENIIIIKNNLTNTFKSFNKLNKNYENIQDKKIVNYLTNYLDNKINNFDFNPLIYNNILKIINNLYNDLSLDQILLQSKYAKEFGYFIKILYLLIDFMDIYTISRLFRDYKQIPYQNSHSAKYSIIITGNAHTENYIKILSDLGFKQLEYHEKKLDGCIHNINQPLFDKK